ncbi:MAG TPA: Lrp/AsnC family transcriptional regulator [Hellea balneolensis]|uniref:Lrp/AsnC family transcriptional regulator n=1 Tax=Hellea balneolensis TaxID=287478 RepID=A0A7C3GB99_9PROT|nr:Lrp/AsnC family transcriptional regulator [Hellea balneolensis]
MDAIDRNILNIVQNDARKSSAEIADAVGVSVSTANERVRKLTASGHVKAWRAVLAPDKVGASLCAFLLLDMDYEGEAAACEALTVLDEVQELHHISGAHSYMMKVRVTDTKALQQLIGQKIKPLAGVLRTHSMLVLATEKETPIMRITAHDQ